MNDKTERDVALVPARIGRDKQRYAEGTNTRLTAGCLCIGPDQKVSREQQLRFFVKYMPLLKMEGWISLRCLPQILLVASMSKPNDWTLPKGGWESDEMEEECAKREARMCAVWGVSVRPLLRGQHTPPYTLVKRPRCRNA
jgi:hypothetical protein